MKCRPDEHPVSEEQHSTEDDQNDMSVPSPPSKSKEEPYFVQNSAGEYGSICSYPTKPTLVPSETTLSNTVGFETARKLLAEWLGTCLLVMVVVASGITGEQLSNDVGIQLTINALATVGGLYGLITIFGPVSGAHFNPCVSFVDFLFKDMSPRDLFLYSCCQIAGGISGSIIANSMFENVDTFVISSKERHGYNLWISEIIATCTLVLVIHGCVRTGSENSVPAVVSLWVGGGYFFTSSSIFANPAVTIGRIFTDTFAGIDPRSALVYIPFQLVGALIGYGLARVFYPSTRQR